MVRRSRFVLKLVLFKKTTEADLLINDKILELLLFAIKNENRK